MEIIFPHKMKILLTKTLKIFQIYNLITSILNMSPNNLTSVIKMKDIFAANIQSLPCQADYAIIRLASEVIADDFAA